MLSTEEWSPSVLQIILKLLERYKYIAAGGDYFEGD